MKTTKTNLILLVIALILLSIGHATAQEPTYRIEGSEIVKIETAKKAKSQPVKTELTYTIKGIVYPVYKGSKGGYYIIRTSKKSGKEYKQYLKVS